MSEPRASIILSTFNQPAALRFSLLGYRRQTFTDFEVVVADDGSNEETRRVVEEMKKESPFPIDHVRQENQGYRRAKIANEAVFHSRGSILILTDGDCIPARNYVELHVSRCPENGFCVGGRMALTKEQTLGVNEEMVASGGYERFLTSGRVWADRWEHFRNLTSVPFRLQGRPKARGCNIAVSRKAYFSINGYDENFAGFNKEDSDLRNRLMMARAKPVSLWGKSYVYHLDSAIDRQHLTNLIPRDAKKSWEYYWREGVTTRCPNGLFKEGETEAAEVKECPRCGKGLPAF